MRALAFDMQVENLRNTLADIEEMIDSALEPLEGEEVDDDDDDDDEDEADDGR